jgi:hypothetical protein
MAHYSEHRALRNEYVEKRDCADRGAGLFALRDFKVGEKICIYSGTIHATTDDHPHHNYALALNDEESVIPDDITSLGGHLSNHSCNPNSSYEIDELRKYGFLEARKSIRRGQEVTTYYQYAHVELVRCLCGDPHCTGQIGIQLQPDDSSGHENLRTQLQKLVRVMRANGQRWVVGSVLAQLAAGLALDEPEAKRVMLKRAFGDSYESHEDFKWLNRMPR